MKLQKFLQVVACLACVVLTKKYGAGLEGSEFGGGWLTGPILDLSDIGTLLFVGALVLDFFYPRVAAGCAAIACLLCLPLYLYFFAPGPVRWIFRGQYSVPTPRNFVWNRWNLAGIASLCVTMLLCFRNLLRVPSKDSML